MNTIKSSTGGTITFSPTGLVHIGNTDHLVDEYKNETGINGRPENDSDSLKFDFSAFPQVAVPAFTGESRVVSF